MPAIIYAVTAPAASAWVRGKMTDEELIHHGAGSQIVFAYHLPDLASYPAMLRECLRLYQAGAVGMIIRTRNPIVERHYKRNGGVIGHIDECGGKRMMGGPVSLARWLARM